jgi:integrase
VRYQSRIGNGGAGTGDLHGPHDLRHTFATWLEDAGIPSRVIDELMGHAGGRRGGGRDGSPMGRVYRETTPAMLARVTTVLDDRISIAEQIAEDLLRGAGRPGEVRAG